MAEVQIDPGYYGQGVNTEIASQNANLGQLKGFFNLGTEVNKRADLTNLYSNATQQGSQPTWDEIGAVYAKYGDTDGADMAKQRGQKQKAEQFGSRMKIYMDQADKAYESGNDDALMTVQNQINNDPLAKDFLNGVELLPNNQVTYVVQGEQEIVMDGGTTKKANKGDQVIAYRGVGEDGQPKMFATSIKPTALSSAVERGKNETSSGTAKSASTFIKRNNTYRQGGRDQFGIYQEGIDKAPLDQAWKQYGLSIADADTEIAQGYIKPGTVKVQSTANRKAIKQRLSDTLKNWKAQEKVQKMIKKGVGAQELVLAFMEENGIPQAEFEEVYDLLFTKPNTGG